MEQTATTLTYIEYIWNQVIPRDFQPPIPVPFNRCPHCQGNILVSKQGVWWDLKCLQAGHTIADYKPGNKDWRRFPAPLERSRGTMGAMGTIDGFGDEDIEAIFGPVVMQSLEELRAAELVAVDEEL
ncbi:MAG TPA: hypothetical protein VF914_21735 [Chloroflexia bacterium]